MRLISAILAMILTGTSFAGQINVGLFSYHFDKEPESKINETHNLIGYRHDNGFGVGYYYNTFKDDSFYLSYGVDKKIHRNYNVGIELAVVSGYADTKINKEIVLMPMLTLEQKIADTGLHYKYILVPEVLAGFGLSYHF